MEWWWGDREWGTRSVSRLTMLYDCFLAEHSTAKHIVKPGVTAGACTSSLLWDSIAHTVTTLAEVIAGP